MKERFIELLMAQGYSRVDSAFYWADLHSVSFGIPSIVLDTYDKAMSEQSTPGIDALTALAATY